MPVNERITLAEEFDDAEALTAFAEQAAPHLDARELAGLDEQAVDGLTELSGTRSRSCPFPSSEPG